MIATSVDISPIARGFERLKRVDGRRVFREARKPVRVDLRDHAKTQSAPRGRWSPLASSTKERRARAGRKRGKLLGRLPGAIAITHGADFVRAQSRVRRWSLAHQEGARVGHGAILRARPYMWVSRTLKRAVRKLFTAALDRAWAGR